MKPPLSNDATPVPDVPPRPTAIAISRTLMLMSYNRFTAMPAASAACVPVPRPTCEKILFDADADAAAIQEDRARALAHPARQFRVACDGDLIHPFCHFCRDADAGLSDRQPDPAIHPPDRCVEVDQSDVEAGGCCDLDCHGVSSGVHGKDVYGSLVSGCRVS